MVIDVDDADSKVLKARIASPATRPWAARLLALRVRAVEAWQAEIGHERVEGVVAHGCDDIQTVRVVDHDPSRSCKSQYSAMVAWWIHACVSSAAVRVRVFD